MTSPIRMVSGLLNGKVLYITNREALSIMTLELICSFLTFQTVSLKL